MAILQTNRSEVEIVRDGTERLNTNVGVNSTNPTATGRSLLEVTAQEMSNMWDTMNDLLRRNFLTTAYGDSLDKIGELLQEPRNGSLRAVDLSTTNVSFYLDETFASNISDLLSRYYTQNDLDELESLGLIDSASNPGQINIPESVSLLSEDETISYNTINDATLNNNQFSDFTPVIANAIGAGFNVGPNALVKHNLVSLFPIFSKIANAIKVKNLYAIRSGTSVESDENYRFRLSNKVVSAVSGNEASIRKATLSVPGVVDMSLVKRSHGNGTFTIFPKTQDPIVSDGIVHAVRESVSFIKSSGDIPFVVPPQYLGVSLKIELRYAPGADKSATNGQVRLAAMDYINNLNEGGEIVINEIIQRVMSVDELLVDMNISEFGFGDYDRTTGIVTGFMPLRLVNQTADWDQRWYTSANLCGVCESGVR